MLTKSNKEELQLAIMNSEPKQKQSCYSSSAKVPNNVCLIKAPSFDSYSSTTNSVADPPSFGAHE